MLWHPSTLSNRRNYVHLCDYRTLLCGYVPPGGAVTRRTASLSAGEAAGRPGRFGGVPTGDDRRLLTPPATAPLAYAGKVPQEGPWVSGSRGSGVGRQTEAAVRNKTIMGTSVATSTKMT